MGPLTNKVEPPFGQSGSLLQAGHFLTMPSRVVCSSNGTGRRGVERRAASSDIAAGRTGPRRCS